MRPDNKSVEGSGGGGRGGDLYMMEEEARPVKLELAHGVSPAPWGNLLRFCFG